MYEKPSPLGEGAEQSEADEGRYAAYFLQLQANWFYISLISQKSKIFASFPQGKPLAVTPWRYP